MAIITCNISISILCGAGIVGELDHLENIEHSLLADSSVIIFLLICGQTKNQNTTWDFS